MRGNGALERLILSSRGCLRRLHPLRDSNVNSLRESALAVCLLLHDDGMTMKCLGDRHLGKLLYSGAAEAETRWRFM